MGLTSWRWWWPRRLADGGGGVSTSAAAASHVETGSSRFMPVDALRKKYSKEPSLEHEDLMEKLALGSHIKGEVCHIKDSPFYILRVAEKGNVDVFGRLYQADPRRLNVRDPRGRTATHQAAERNKTLILRFIASRAGDLNVQDNAGNTPLHVAVASEALDSIDFLIKNGADTSVLNEKKQAPLHLATELNKVKVLRALIEHKDKFNIQQGGEHGRTPLHIAAILDLDECACILTKEFGACPRQPCHNGYYPIHEAAKNASSKTLEVFLEWGEGRGCSREEMMSFYDAEGNVPLHSAVHGGDIKAVELCLKNGAKISTTQQDLSTPVHLACAQGAKKVIELMFIMQPSEKSLCLASCDIQKMTPVHCAAMFDHVETVEFLAKEGADLNAEDKDGRSALLLAASRAAWRTVHRLISLGADVGLQDSNQRNALHLVVLNGGRLEEFADHLKKCKSEECLRQLLNEKDETGCTPLHYASRGGHIRSLQNLIQLGASVNLKNNNNESALHFAARYGRYNIACQLLDSDKGTFIINETDGKGLTPLHISSQEGHRKVVQLLLNRGALLHRDHNGRNPLHLAAMSGYTKTMELLHSVHSHLIDQVDKDGNSALHLATMENKPSSIKMLLSMGCKLLKNRQGFGAIDYALYYKFPEAALAMVTHEERGEEILSQSSEKYPLVVLALIAYMPHVYGAVLDKGIIKANCKKDSKEFYIKYNFKCLENFQTAASPDQPSGKEVESEKTLPLPVLNAMVAHGRVELLSHPLSQKYLQVKWNSYGKYFHITNLLFYLIFLTLVTLYIANILPKCASVGSRPLEVSSMCNLTFEEGNSSLAIVDDYIHKRKTPMMYFTSIGIVSFILVNIVREGVQAYQQRWRYLLDPFNSVTWILYSSALIMISPIFGAQLGVDIFPCASITAFLSWFALLSYLQRFNMVGIYIVMFLEVLQTLIRVLLVFSILIIAFGLAFYILLSQGKHQSFSSIPLSLMRTFSMMLGEIDFLGTFVSPYISKRRGDMTKAALPYANTTFFILVIFMVFMPILIMNLLIGLAVGDIESVRRNAQLKRLAMQLLN
ncbi:transient receptor potential cation channel subfamily A member 1-like isoform X2 [Ischnura elegans]|uniref:transient receptor potential cation channel subfamily A member 1-like isoform X2 n=1 Tax=Ischnura elegans TaxID=197161 RepID=UPI001ED86F9A|nr:transient receptor potential cation channel subfamily A member 1-like isoform X2 [Ischnura elegans]